VNLPERAKDFWFGPDDDPARLQPRQIWFRSTPEFDAALRDAFLPIFDLAADSGLAAWEGSAEGALALVLQVPRDLFRGTPRAYGTDAAARAAADRALARRFDEQLPPVWRQFFYLPFHHSEDFADQQRARTLFEALPPDNPERADTLRYARRYHEIIARFGRFPHRNAILGRESTAEEIAFLAEAGASSAPR
jgi:uncharacterized protein (DUF924 family)